MRIMIPIKMSKDRNTYEYKISFRRYSNRD